MSVFGFRVATDGIRVVVAGENFEDPSVNMGAVFVYIQENGIDIRANYRFPDADAPFSSFTTHLAGDIQILVTLWRSVHQTTMARQQTRCDLYLKLINGSWVFSQKLMPPEAEPGDRSGPLALSENHLIIGCHMCLSQAGAVYTYTKQNGVFEYVQKILPSNSTTNARFGWKLGLSGNRLLVGAPYDPDDPDGTAGPAPANGIIWAKPMLIHSTVQAGAASKSFSIQFLVPIIILGARSM